MTTKIEAVQMLEAMRTAATQDAAALMGLKAEIAPGVVNGLGAQLGNDQRALVQAQIYDAITTARNHRSALGHIAEVLTRAYPPAVEP